MRLFLRLLRTPARAAGPPPPAPPRSFLTERGEKMNTFDGGSCGAIYQPHPTAYSGRRESTPAGANRGRAPFVVGVAETAVVWLTVPPAAPSRSLHPGFLLPQ